MLDELAIRVLALKHNIDPRTLRKEWRRPGSVRGTAGWRARRALIELGAVPCDRQSKPPPSRTA